MKAFGFTLRIAGATLALLAWQILWNHPRNLAELCLLIIPDLLVVLALGLVAASSHQEGWKLSGTLFVLYFGINQLNTLDEALLFKVGLKAPQVFRMMASSFLTALIFCPMLVLILDCWKKTPQEEVGPLVPRPAVNWMVRILLGVLLYVLCYFVAGIIALPFVKDLKLGFQTSYPESFLAISSRARLRPPQASSSPGTLNPSPELCATKHPSELETLILLPQQGRSADHLYNNLLARTI